MNKNISIIFLPSNLDSKRLQADELLAASFEVETKNFYPHVTLLTFSGIKTREIRKEIESFLISIHSFSLLFDRITIANNWLRLESNMNEEMKRTFMQLISYTHSAKSLPIYLHMTMFNLQNLSTEEQEKLQYSIALPRRIHFDRVAISSISTGGYRLLKIYRLK